MGKLGTMLQIGRTFGMRHGMLRLGYELERGSGWMSRRLRAVAGWQSWDLERIAPGPSAEELLSARREGGRPFFFADSRALAPALTRVLGREGEASLCAEAERILHGDLPYFGRLSFPCGFPPNWFENPQTKQSVAPDRSWTTMRFASDDYGDLKFILEPSRFLFVYPLARAYTITGDERFAEGFWTAAEDWAHHNPPMSGPLWVCGQECSLRILAWTFGLYAFLHSAATTPKRFALLLSMIAAHAWRTRQTIGYARSQRSNHVFSEAIGLWTAGILFPELSGAMQWRNQGAELLHEAVLDQIAPEGSYRQDSFNYLRMVLHQLFWTLRLAGIYGVQLHSAIHQRAEAAYEFLRSFVDSASGYMPNYGSNDGSHILPLTACDYGDFRPLLQLGARVLKHQRALSPGPWDESALWLCGTLPDDVEVKSVFSPQVRAERTGANRAHAPAQSDTGYHRIGSENSWALVRASSGQRRPFQADQLHVDLWWNGLNLARDPGTYLYNGEPPWDNVFAGTAVHNTVMVDGRDQMRRAGRFLWLDWAHASGQSSSRSSHYPDRFDGEHDGYRQLAVRHCRSVDSVSEDAWLIMDDLFGSGEHELRLHWLLPDFPLTVIPGNNLAALLTTEKARFSWNIFSSAPGTPSIIRAGKKQHGGDDAQEGNVFGWESPTYGELRPATSLLYQVRARLPVRLITVVLVNDSFQVQLQGSNVALLRAGSAVYEVAVAPGAIPDVGPKQALQSRKSPL